MCYNKRMSNVIVAPSLLSGNFADMGSEVKSLDAAGADWVHVDVMDGMFVPNITFGFKMISDLRPLTVLPFDVHLMIAEPKRYVDRFIAAGADILTVHIEAEPDVAGTLESIRRCGAKAGLAVDPDTPIESVLPYVGQIDLLLIMTVFPGFGGQKFIDGSLQRIAEARALRAKCGFEFLIEVDGGITLDNAASAAAAGADVIVGGNSVFGAKDRAAAIKALRG